MTYMDFLRRATTLENEDACRRRMEELDRNTTNQFGGKIAFMGTEYICSSVFCKKNL